jgi:hypothetical protein
VVVGINVDHFAEAAGRNRREWESACLHSARMDLDPGEGRSDLYCYD